MRYKNCWYPIEAEKLAGSPKNFGVANLMREQTKIWLFTAVMAAVAFVGLTLCFFLKYGEYVIVEELTLIIGGVFGVVLIFIFGDKEDDKAQ
jgi:hypothetical protein